MNTSLDAVDLEHKSYDDLMSELENLILSLNIHLNQATRLLKHFKTHLENKKTNVDDMLEMAKHYDAPDGEIIKFNVRGSNFATLKSTLIKDCGSFKPHLLQLMVSGAIEVMCDENKAIFIDRNPQYFGNILDYLHNVGGNRPYIMPELSQQELKKFYDEAEYYKIDSLLEMRDKSKILSPEMFAKLNELCKFPKNQPWQLLYRASTDGFASASFHEKCDKHPNTISIIKSTTDCVFGGYTNVAWDQSQQYRNDGTAFIFSLINKSNTPVILNCTNAAYGIYCHSTFGPTFGAGHCLNITSDSNLNTDSYSNPSSAYYQLPTNCTDGSANAHQFLAGSRNFQVKEIEVFKKI